MNEKLALTVGYATREARQRAGLTQAQVAEALHLHPLLYGRMERGKLLPSIATLRQLCATLDVGADALLGRPHPDPVAAEAAFSQELSELLAQMGEMDERQVQALQEFVSALRH